MSGDHDERNLTIREVNEVMQASGLNPFDVREFAWQLVEQELGDDLPTAFSPRMIELGKRLRKLIARLEGDGTTKEMLTMVLNGIISDLTDKKHKDKREAYEAELKAKAGDQG